MFDNINWVQFLTDPVTLASGRRVRRDLCNHHDHRGARLQRR